MSQQQATTGPALMERVERTSAIIVYPQQRIGGVQKNPYAMNVDRRENRNCYNCGGFRHLARNCRNRREGNRIREGRRLEYRGNGDKKQNNLNEEQDLILLD